MTEEEFKAFVAELAMGLNTLVFPKVDEALRTDPSLRQHLNPAFPFPQKVRIGVLDTHLVVEYVGPEDPAHATFSVEAIWRPGVSVFDFLGIEVEHLSPVHIPVTASLENVQVFLGDAMNLLGDYLYDIVSNPHDLLLNGILDFTNASEPTYVSNVTFLWSDREGALRIRRIDFLELVPIQKAGWAYHTEESFAKFAEFLVHHGVPRYRPQLHAILNQFIALVVSSDASEPMITGYLANHPEILQLAFGADNLNPQIDLEWQYPSGKPNLKPDFMPEKMDGYADVLEFKLPRLKSRAVVGPHVRSHPSFEVD